MIKFITIKHIVIRDTLARHFYYNKGIDQKYYTIHGTTLIKCLIK